MTQPTDTNALRELLAGTTTSLQFATVASEHVPALLDELDRLRDENYKFKWQVRDTCARAEKAEAERDELKLALEEADRRSDAQLHEWNKAEAELSEARKERALIVDWLRDRWANSPGTSAGLWFADAIERGEHKEKSDDN